MANKIVHKRSSALLDDGGAKLPTADSLEYGELAINFADGVETISIKNTNDEIVEFKSKEYFENQLNESELVIAQAFNDLNDRTLVLESIDHEAYKEYVNEQVSLLETNISTLSGDVDTLKSDVSGLQANTYFRAFETYEEYETSLANGEIVYPCISVIKDSGEIKFIPGNFYNAIVTLSSGYINGLGGMLKQMIGGYPMCFTEYLDSFIVNGVEMIDSAEVVSFNGVEMKVIMFPSEEIGINYNINFKIKEEPTLLLSTTQDVIESDLSLLSVFYGSLIYIEIDESLNNRALATDSGKYYNACSLMLGFHDNLEIKFKDDYFGKNIGSGLSPLFGYIYGIIQGDYESANITLSIPDGNSTYGTSDDVWSGEIGTTPTFYGEYNYLVQQYPNINFTLLTY